VEGIKRKDFEFYKFVQKLDAELLVFSETWCYEEPPLFKKYLNDYSNIIIVPATPAEGGRGRPKGGLILASKTKLATTITVNTISIKINTGMNTNMDIAAVYFPPDEKGDTIMKNTFEMIFDNEPENILIIGDMNARIGDFTPPATLNDDNSERKSKDKVTSGRGRKLINVITENGLCVLNGTKCGDPNGEFTFNNANGASVVDLAVASMSCVEIINNFKVLSSHLSTHSPILVELYPADYKGKEKAKQFMTKIIWDKSKREEFTSALQASLTNIKEEWTWNSFKSAIYVAAEEIGVKKVIPLCPTIQNARWYDPECKEKRLLLRNILRVLRRQLNKATDVELRAHYINERNIYQKMKQDKKKAYYSALLENIINAENPSKFWDSLNKFRPGKSAQTNKIDNPTWEKFFTSVFKASDINEVEMLENETEEAVEDEMDRMITIEEMKIAIKKLGVKKAPGTDGIPNEIYKIIATVDPQKLLQLLNTLFETKDFPDEWTTSMIIPIFKKGDRDLPDNYRPISLICTGLKLLTSILSKRLATWIDKNNKISEYQTGFRSGTGTMEQVFTLMTIMQKKLQESGGKLYAAFFDIKSAFDSPPHHKLWQRMKHLGVGKKKSHFSKRSTIIQKQL
jgi:hypothetical protein